MAARSVVEGAGCSPCSSSSGSYHSPGKFLVKRYIHRGRNRTQPKIPVVEMATRALNFIRAARIRARGYVGAVSRVEAIVARSEQLALQQRDGLSEVRAAVCTYLGRAHSIRRPRNAAWPLEVTASSAESRRSRITCS
jgi:hypothetical protein